MVDIAAETHGALFTFNHRYFGNNLPTQNASFENMKYNTVEQSLGDIATFIRYLRSQPSYSKVILWGSGYGGTVATWARMKFPHLVDAVWSSSGMFDIHLYTSSQYDRLQHIIASVGSNACSTLLRNAFDVIDYLVLNGEGEYLQDRLHLCHPVDTDSILDVAALYESHINDVIVHINMHHSPGILTFCRDMAAIPGDYFNSFARWIEMTFGSSECYDHTFNGQVERFSNVEWNSVGTNTGRRQWYHIQCTQLGLFLVAHESVWLPLRVPITYHIERCEQILGENYNSSLLHSANADLTHSFGSLNPSVSNVIYTNGDIDPWLYTGMLATPDPNTVAMIIDAYSKSADLTSINLELDTEILVQAKERIRRQIIEWSSD